MPDLTPQQIVAELDRFIVGQTDAKRSLGVALRERERRKQLPEQVRAEIASKNILIIGPTGVGKTELAKRLANLADAPFLKTEATKFTEVGYVGRDAESIVRDLADTSVAMVHQEKVKSVREDAEKAATERILNYLLENTAQVDSEQRAAAAQRAYMKRKRHTMAQRLAALELEERVIEIEIEGEEAGGTMLEFVSGMGSDEVHEQFQEFVASMGANRKRSKLVSVREARRILVDQEVGKLIDFEEVVDTAVRRVEESGIVFIDEIDKLVTRGADYGADVSGEGVQRDLLPIVEGASVATRYGMINTEHILFIAAGAFNRARPADLIPELQGRFPIRVEVKDLGEDDFVRILTEPDNALTQQYVQLLGTEQITVKFAEDGIREVARYAAILNMRTENLGVRRLHGVLERVLQEVSFRASESAGQEIVVDAEFVRTRMADVPFTDEASKFIL